MDIQTLNSNKDKAIYTAAALFIASAFTAYFWLNAEPNWLRVIFLFGLLAVAATLVLLSSRGKEFLHYVRDAWRELAKVIWPTRKEALQMTGVVFVFVFIMSLLLWSVDKLLEVILAWILGW